MMVEMGHASPPIRGVEEHRPASTNSERTGSDMHAHAPTGNATDYESAALPLSYWPYTAGENVTGGQGLSAASGQEWATSAPDPRMIRPHERGYGPRMALLCAAVALAGCAADFERQDREYTEHCVQMYANARNVAESTAVLVARVAPQGVNVSYYPTCLQRMHAVSR